jgi:hypothetical protein
MSYMDRFGQPQGTQTTPTTAVATTAPSTRSDIVGRLSQFYSDHPTLVKILGTIAVAQLARKMTRR